MKYVAAVAILAVALISTGLQTAQAQSNADPAEVLCRRLFKKQDKDRDGAITKREAAGPVATLFDQIDRDSNGELTAEELTAAICARVGRTGEPQPRDSRAGHSGFTPPQAAHRSSQFVPDPWLGWGHDDAPEVSGATYLKSPEEIRAMADGPLSYPKGSGLRIVGTGHSWMAPGYATLPAIAAASGVKQQLRTHTSGGERGGLRMIWEKENGILTHQGRPSPKCMAAITTGQWDVMTWGCYTNDRPEYYRAWIDFCLKFNPDMEFYVFNAWPQYADGFIDGATEPRIEGYRARAEVIHETFRERIAELDKHYPGKVHVLPTCDAMMLAIELYFQGKLPGMEGLSRLHEHKSPAIWSDGGHLGTGMDRLEGYVFYATLYKQSPERIEGELPFHNDQLDKVFRKIAWQAVISNRLSGVTDRDGNGIGDEIQ